MLDNLELKAFKQMMQSNNCTTDGLVRVLNISKPGVIKMLKRMEQNSLIRIQKKGHKLCIEITDNCIVRQLMSLLSDKPNGDFHHILNHNSMTILSTLLVNRRTSNQISQITGINLRTVQKTIKQLNYRLIIKKEEKPGCRYSFRREYFQGLFDLVESYKNRVSVTGHLLWQLNKEYVYTTQNESNTHTLTGFNAFKNHGVFINNIKYCYYSKEKNLSREEILIHGLLQTTTDPRTTCFCIVYLLKNNLNLKKLKFYSLKYDVENKLDDILATIRLLRHPDSSKPFYIDKSTLYQVLKLYHVQGVKYV